MMQQSSSNRKQNLVMVISVVEILIGEFMKPPLDYWAFVLPVLFSQIFMIGLFEEWQIRMKDQLRKARGY
jgi:hypothetical protein